MKYTIDICNLNYNIDNTTILKDINLKLEKGSRCVLVGRNGVGKSTLLKILGGKHLYHNCKVNILDKDSYNDTCFLNHKRLYVDPNWGIRTVAFAGCGIPYTADIPVSDMMKNLQDEFPERVGILRNVLEINMEWKMHLLSDGQRRRVQLFLALIRPYYVFLLDEVVAVLDIITRKKLLDFLKKESIVRNVTIIFATHVFDGLDEWSTHVLFLQKPNKNLSSISYFDSTPNLYLKYKSNHFYNCMEELIVCTIDDSKEFEANEIAVQEKNSLSTSNYNAGGFSSGRLINLDSSRMYNYW